MTNKIPSIKTRNNVYFRLLNDNLNSLFHTIIAIIWKLICWLITRALILIWVIVISIFPISVATVFDFSA